MIHLAYNLYQHCKHAGEQELNFAIVGLPNGGKTTIKKVLNGDNAPMVVPTIGATKPIEYKVSCLQQVVFHNPTLLCFFLPRAIPVASLTSVTPTHATRRIPATLPSLSFFNTATVLILRTDRVSPLFFFFSFSCARRENI